MTALMSTLHSLPPEVITPWWQTGGIRLLSEEAITGDSLVITLDVSSATSTVRVKGLALQTEDQSGTVGRLCGAFN